VTLKIKESKQFKKDYERIVKQNKDVSKIREAVRQIASGNIDKKYNDHKLYSSRNYKNVRELHIEPDWLLIYSIDKYELTLLLLRTGSHSDLF